MLPPDRFGHRDVRWRPSPDETPGRVVAFHLQHKIVTSLRDKYAQLSVRGLADLLGVSKSAAGRWLSGQEFLSLAELGLIASVCGADVLEPPDPLLPTEYLSLVVPGSEPPAFGIPDQPAWERLAAAVGDFVGREQAADRLSLLTAPVVAHVFAIGCEELPPTRLLTVINPNEPASVRLELPTPINVEVVVDLRDSRAGDSEPALGTIAGSRDAASRRVRLEVLTARAHARSRVERRADAPEPRRLAEVDVAGLVVTLYEVAFEA